MNNIFRVTCLPWGNQMLWAAMLAFQWILGIVPAAGQANVDLAYTFSTLAGKAVAGSADGVGDAAQFHRPSGIALDAAGNLYVTDTLNHTVRRVSSAGVVSTVAGLPGNAGSDDGPASEARFREPSGIAVDSEGIIYVADTGNHTIRRITPGGFVSTFSGFPGFPGSSDVARLFLRPNGLTLDRAGNVYVSDSGNHTIRKINPAGVVSTIAGFAGNSGSANGAGSNARFNFPLGITVDTATNIYVADSNNNTIRKISVDGLVSTLAGLAGSSGGTDGTGNKARFLNPQGIIVDGTGNLYVADSYNSTIRKVTAAGAVSTLAGSALQFGSTDETGSKAKFYQPYGIALDSGGNLYVADSYNNTIRRVTAAGVVSTLAGLVGTSVFSAGSADGTGDNARFNLPTGIAVDKAGNSYVADTGNHTIRQITSAGVVSTIAGLAGNPGTNNGTGSNARFNQPSGIALDSLGIIYVADTTNHTIRRITSAGVVGTLAGLAGKPGANNGTGSGSRFNGPTGIAVDNAFNVYVADSDNHTIRKITALGVVSTIAGAAGKPGSTDGSSNAKFFHPTGLVLDGATNIYVVDSYNSTIRKLTPTGLVTTVAGVAGRTGTADGMVSSARFYFPDGIAIDRADNLYVIEPAMHTIRKITPAGRVSTIAGFPDRSGNTDGTGRSALFSEPHYIAIDGGGSVYVADTRNNTIRKGVFTQYQAANPVPNPRPVMNGRLTMTLTPAEASGQWRFPWEFGWRNSGSTVSNLAEGNYSIEFRNVSGFRALPLQQVQVGFGEETSVTNIYYPTMGADGGLGALSAFTVLLGPTPPPTAGWRFLGDSGPFLPSGYTTNLSSGTYLIEFATASGRVKPPNQAVSIEPGNPFVLSVNYLLAAPLPEGIYLPSLVPANLISDVDHYPFGFVGQLQSDTGYGSGVAVQTNVVLTAAHLVFSDQTLSYVSRVHWFSRRDAGVLEPLPLASRAFYVLSGYASQRTNDLASGYFPDQSTPPSRNTDVAAIYFGDPVAGGGYAGYLPSDSIPNTWLSSAALKMLVGYPVDGSIFRDANIVPGKMYQTEPQPLALSLAGDPVPGQSQNYIAPWFLSYPGASGGPLFVQLNDTYYPAAVYLGTLFSGSRPYASVVRAIDTNVVSLITQATALGDSGTNFTGGGVIRFVNTAAGGARSLQLFTVNFLPPEIATQAQWQLVADGSSFRGSHGRSYVLLAPTNFVVAFSDLSGYTTPTNFPVSLQPGTNAVLEVTYTLKPSPPPVLSASYSGGLRVSGQPGTKVQLQFRRALGVGDWADVPGKAITLASTPTILITSTEGADNPGYYRVRWLP